MSIIDDIRALWETSPELFVAAVLGCLIIWVVIWKATRTAPDDDEEPAPKRRRKKKRKKERKKPPGRPARQRRTTRTYECADCGDVLGPDDSYRCTACGDDFCADCGDIHLTEQCM